MNGFVLRLHTFLSMTFLIPKAFSLWSFVHSSYTDHEVLGLIAEICNYVFVAFSCGFSPAICRYRRFTFCAYAPSQGIAVYFSSMFCTRVLQPFSSSFAISHMRLCSTRAFSRRTLSFPHRAISDTRIFPNTYSTSPALY